MLLLTIYLVFYFVCYFVAVYFLVSANDYLTILYRQLLVEYNKEIRPIVSPNQPINTSIAFSLVQVVDVDERNQLLTVLAWVHLRWNDWRLAWDPKKFAGINKLNIPVGSIWIPDIILYNNAAQQYLNEMTTAGVVYDGNISLSMAGIFKSSCALDVRFYPFDFQNCLMKFASWAYDGTKIDIWSDSDSDDQSKYMISTEWTLRHVRAVKNSVIYSCCSEPYPFIDVHLLLERKPLFFIIFLCLPCVMISMLVLLGFYMSSDSGEKVTLGITSLLSTTVFLMLVSEHLPPTADALPLIGIYYGVTIFIVSLQTAFTVLTLNIHHLGNNGPPVPKILQKLLFCPFIQRFLFLNGEKQYHSINEHVDYFFEKQINEEIKEEIILDEDRRRSEQSNNKAYLNKQQIPKQQTSEPPVWELASPQIVNNQQKQNNFTIKKRVSFSENSKKINNNKERFSLISISSNNLKENEESKNNISFEDEFIKVIGRLQEIMER
ncbi:unnamed protein product [Meloidogyne enterolobii]|uniref:Uncharacterized protein n=1 Tax=Meloidogyne enterolobii TaxID=390850 RepID=A0ACB1A6Q4_MELEN